MNIDAATERAAAVAYLRLLAKSRPPESMLARHPEWTAETLNLFEATFNVAADQIERGQHLAVDGGEQ